MTQPVLTAQDIQFINELTRESGQMAMEMRANVGVHQKSGPNDLVTDADLTISRFLVGEMEQRFPNDLIISEEQKHGEPTEPTAALPQRIWFIDPIDGTENYVKQDGQYTTMIGLLADGIPYYGWIFQPSVSTLFYGGAEFGAWKQVGNANPIRYERSALLQDSPPYRLMMGWTDRRKFPWVCDLPQVRFVDSDSLGLKIMKILDGQADIFVSLSGRVKLWDTAAPAAIGLGAALDVGTALGDRLAFPTPQISHGSSVIIGRPGSISWAVENIKGHLIQSSR